MSWLCFFGHDYEPLPKEFGVHYLGDDGAGFNTWPRWNGPEKCRRCGASHRGFRIPSAPPMPPVEPPRANARNTDFVRAIVEASGECPSVRSWAAAMEAADAFQRTLRNFDPKPVGPPLQELRDGDVPR